MLTQEQDDLITRMCGQKMHVRTIASVLLISEADVKDAKQRLGLGKKPRRPGMDRESADPPPPPRPHVAPDELREHDRMIPASQRRRTIHQLRNRECHWPVGEVGDEGFFFCGGRTSTEREVYCDYHRTAATNYWRRGQ